jgi:hypothetical protein
METIFGILQHRFLTLFILVFFRRGPVDEENMEATAM